jgi:hypothetical protein
VLRGAIRVWDFQNRQIVRSVQLPSALGSMDVQLIPGDPQGRAFTANMFEGLLYLVDTKAGTAKAVFDCNTVVPHIPAPTPGGMAQLLAMPQSGDRLLFDLFQAGQVVMLDISDPEHPFQTGGAQFRNDVA